MTKVGILNCSNAVSDFKCCACKCFDSIDEKNGEFTRYDGDFKVVGMVSCSGCPTSIGAEKILNSVKPLVVMGVEKLHFSNCMLAVCPFKKKYEKIIKDNFPKLEIVYGTHEADKESAEVFMKSIKEVMVDVKTAIDVIPAVAESLADRTA